MTSRFGAEIKAYIDKTKDGLENVLKTSVQDVLDIAQTPKAKGGRMPVDTGNLRNSLVSGLNGSAGAQGADGYALVIAGMELGDEARFGWTAPYALRMELGFTGQDSLGRNYQQTGNHFVGSAAAQWPGIVARNAAEWDK
jgi:hypothetical protein